MKAFVLLVLLVSSVAQAGPTTRFMWLPNRLLDAETPPGGVAMGNMRCGGYVPAEGITGATQIAFYVTTAGASGALCGAAIYDAPGTTQIATTGGVNCEGVGAKLVSGLTSFDLGQGVKYNICVCGNAAAATARYLSWTNEVSDIARSYSGKVWRFAANNCDSSGNPPSMTGSLTDSSLPPPMMLIGTNSP